MRILLLGHGRCGSTSLQLGLSDVLKLDTIIEPFNSHLWDTIYKTEPPYLDGDVIPDNVIFKNIIGPNFNNQWVIDNHHKFDVVILLLRANIRETLISHTNAKIYGYSDKYVAIDHITHESIEYVNNNYTWLFDFYTSTPNVNLVWYEDLYGKYDMSSKVIKSLGIPIGDFQLKLLWDNYLNPTHRLRQV
jgi:hypothetical protein